MVGYGVVGELCSEVSLPDSTVGCDCEKSVVMGGYFRIDRSDRGGRFLVQPKRSGLGTNWTGETARSGTSRDRFWGNKTSQLRQYRKGIELNLGSVWLNWRLYSLLPK